MTKKYFYHVSPNHNIHKGTSASCTLCKREKVHRKKASKATTKTSGKKGGKKSSKRAKKVRHDKATPRTCSVCGKKIDRKNKSGLCIVHYNEQRNVAKKKADASRKQCSMEGCTNLLGPTNQSGLCFKCFAKSDAWNQRRKTHGEWVTSAIRARGIKDPTDDAPEPPSRS